MSKKDEEIEELAEDITGNVANLSAALSSLSEVDSALLSKTGQQKLSKVKRQIFAALVFYSDQLPKEKQDEEDN